MAQLICGIWRLDGRPVDLRLFEAMLDGLIPSGSVWVHDQIVDGSIAMAVVDVGTAASPPGMPTISRTARGLLAGDARLYGKIAGTSSAHELAARIEQAGSSGLAECHGDFAFAHWDRACHRLMLGRDHFGVRPLQFTIRAKESVAFASLPTALLHSRIASRVLNERVIASFPVNGQPLPGETFFRDIQCVRAAHTVTVDKSGSVRSKRYWRLALEAALPLDTDPAQAAVEIRRLLDQAVRRRLPAAGSVASHMSGGLDSTPIAILAARALQADGRTCFAYSFQERKDERVEIVDEAPYVADAVAENSNLLLLAVTSPSYFSILSQGVDPDTMIPMAADEPEEVVLAHAAAHGAGILLSGWGGDQVVSSSGGGVESELFRNARWSQMMRELKSRSEQTGRSLGREFIARIVRRQLPPRLKTWLRNLQNQDSWLAWSRFTAPDKRALGVFEQRPEYAGSRATRRAELEAWWIPYRLEMFAQQGAPYGIAYAYPMLDLDLLRYAMRLPGTLYRREGVPRRLIRDAVDGIVPESVRWRVEKLAPYPAEALRIAAERESIIRTLRELSQRSLVTEFLDIDAIVGYLKAGRSEEQIREHMADSASRGQQITSEEDDHEFALRVAFFLKAQGEVSVE